MKTALASHTNAAHGERCASGGGVSYLRLIQLSYLYLFISSTILNRIISCDIYRLPSGSSLTHSIGGILMISMFKARYSIFYSLLFASMVCQSFAATRGKPQIAESDSPREALKKSVYAFHNVKSYRVRMERKYS